MAKKVYAIKEGFDAANGKKVENKIVGTWAECLKYVKGVKGAKYKSFESLDEANKFLNEGTGMLKKGVDNYPMDCLHIYVDGSYNVESKKYSFGMVAVRNNIVEYIDSAASVDSSQNNIRQIAGELEGSVKGVEYALSQGDKKVVIFHDYEGIAHHATGFWDRKEESSANYYDKMNGFMALGIEIVFVKVDSHTGDFFNELVDEKCKEALGISSDKVVQKWLGSNKLKVKDLKVKEQVLTLAPSCSESITIDNNNIVHKNETNSFDIDNLIIIYKKQQEKATSIIEKLSSEEKSKLIHHLLEKI